MLRTCELGRRGRWAALLGALVLAMGLAGAARADQTHDDELKARKLFGAGNYKGALDIFMLYPQGRISEVQQRMIPQVAPIIPGIELAAADMAPGEQPAERASAVVA